VLDISANALASGLASPRPAMIDMCSTSHTSRSTTPSTSLAKCRGMDVLNLGQNKLTNEIPTSFANMLIELGKHLFFCFCIFSCVDADRGDDVNFQM
jgi:hypothetical protein